MANNRIQVKRTNVAGRTANVTSSGNTQFIDAGEFALNMADGILYTSNGSALIEVGANNATISSGNSTANLFANSTFLRIANSTTSSNLTSSSLIAGISTVNTTVVAVGSNNFMNATALDIGNTVITTTNVVFGGTIAANGGIGTLGQVLTSGAAGNAYWTTPTTGTVTSVATGNGMTGGPITTTGTVSVLANTGIVANTTGTFVNATYIATIASNTSLYSNGSFTNTFTVGTASYFVANGNLGIGTSVPSTKLSVNPKVIDDNSHTYDSNTVYITHQSPTATATLNDPKPVLILARQGTSGQAFGAAAEFNISRYENNSTNSRTRMDIRLADGSFLSQNTAVMTMLSNGSVGIGNTAPNAKLQVTGTANVSGNVAIAGITTLSTNVVLGTTTITANGSVGTAGQVLTSGAAGNAYWSTVAGGSGTVTSVASGNGITGGTITATGTLVAVAGAGVVVNTSGINVLANTGIIANTTGTFVNASYIATITANNATFINGNNVLTVMESLRANRSLHGGGTITVDGSGNVLWGSRYIVISNGRGTHFSTDGYFDINCPTTGTITGVGGASNKTATAAGIPLGGWEALYYILPIGSTAASVAANFRVVYFTSDVEIPSNWLLICAQNGDNSNYYFNNGVILKAGQSFAGATFTSANMPQANNANNLGGVAAASYVQNTDSRTLSGNLVISGTSFTPSSNTILLGNSTQRWVLSANTGSFSGAVSGITTLATGNTTITGFANVTTTIQGGSSLTIAGALSGVTTSAMGNTTITGFVNATSSVNAASHTVGTAFTANSTVVNAVSYYAGTLLVANSTVSNATHLGGVAAASYVQNTDSRILSGNLNFTGTNNFFSTGLFVGANVIANTTALFVGNSTANSTTNTTAVTAHIQFSSRKTLGFNYTVANTVNSLIVGPYQVNTGFTLTVETGARLVIA